MPLFRRKETLSERLLREGGLDAPQEPPAPYDPLAGRYANQSPWALVASATALNRPRQWDAVVTVDAPGLAGDRAEFTTLPDGSLIVDEDEERDLGRLAEAVERELAPPYTANAVRQERSIWAVTANAIDVVRVRADGDEIEVALRDGERHAAVDGVPTSRAYPELERLGEQAGGDYAVHAERLDGDLWQVRVGAL